MAIWHADNFTIYGTDRESSVNQMLDGVYSAIGRGSLNDYFWLQDDPDGITSGKVVQFVGTTNQYPYYRIAHPLGSQTGMGIASREWFTNLPTNDDWSMQIHRFLDPSSTTLLYVAVSSTGRLHVQSSTGSVGTTDAPVMTAAGWYHIETWVDQTNVEVRVEGVTVLGPVAHGITSPAWAQCGAGNSNSGLSNNQPNRYHKDLVCMDDTGSYNNTFIGSVIVTNLMANGDVSLNWTPSTGSTGYTILDNIPPNDSEYIYAEDDPVPSPYVGSLTDLPAEVTSVKAVITFVRAAKSDGGDGSMQVGLISDPDGTPATALGSDRPITVAQTYWRDVFEEDPKTDAPWLPAAVNAAQIQIDRTT